MDFAAIGANIKAHRKRFRMSTRELASRAGVSRNTIVRLEGGLPCKDSTIQRLRVALSMSPDQLLRMPSRDPFCIHRPQDAHWTVSVPPTEYRRVEEGEEVRHVDDELERLRLGELKFQPAFTMVMGSEIPGGVASHATIELYQETWSTQHFGEEFVYCLCGPVKVIIGDRECLLEQGEAIGFDATVPHRYSPVHWPIQLGKVPRILVVVSMRPGEQIPPPVITPHKSLNPS